ncbi:hypothetical protein JAAARDRAFT_195344 [Jaapia argillacea MUCL 33604]|uniref:Uncharacterized protein n=1 Tax=Jaapia argillacea MUCL 33604 TaxID=933084 RepID=A0A067PQQ2_9AGAM|nr:hypothetical protein JAAARDRAFT_195344 [Jaapia argillacea MUCL 33604]
MATKFFLLVFITSVLVVSVAALPLSPYISCLESVWLDIVVFFTVNYVAHAATVPTGAGMRWYDTTFTTVSCLLLPFTGLQKSVTMMAVYRWSGSSDLEKARARGALLIVARSADWRPAEKPEDIYVKLPKGFSNSHEIPVDLPSATIRLVDDLQITTVSKERFYIHGQADLPDGYTLARAGPYLKMAISVGQLLYSSFTLYKTQGDQVDHYGYAAYGFSVFPYAFMSLVNLVCIGLVGEYPSLYVLRTAIMEEARRRGGMLNGYVGSCKIDESSNGPDGGIWQEYTLAKVWQKTEVKEGGSGEGQSILVIEVDGIPREFKYRPDVDGQAHVADVLEFGISPVGNQNAIPSGSYTTRIPPQRMFRDATLPVLVFLALPYMVIYGLSRFEARGSTLSERIWMMLWLSSGQYFSGAFLVIVPIHAPHTLLTSWKRLNGLPLLTCIILPIPAIGGFITVGKMLLASHPTC